MFLQQSFFQHLINLKSLVECAGKQDASSFSLSKIKSLKQHPDLGEVLNITYLWMLNIDSETDLPRILSFESGSDAVRNPAQILDKKG
jgi:hypothetical protein